MKSRFYKLLLAILTISILLFGLASCDAVPDNEINVPTNIDKQPLEEEEEVLQPATGGDPDTANFDVSANSDKQPLEEEEEAPQPATGDDPDTASVDVPLIAFEGFDIPLITVDDLTDSDVPLIALSDLQAFDVSLIAFGNPYFFEVPEFFADYVVLDNGSGMFESFNVPLIALEQEGVHKVTYIFATSETAGIWGTNGTHMDKASLFGMNPVDLAGLGVVLPPPPPPTGGSGPIGLTAMHFEPAIPFVGPDMYGMHFEPAIPFEAPYMIDNPDSASLAPDSMTIPNPDTPAFLAPDSMTIHNPDSIVKLAPDSMTLTNVVKLSDNIVMYTLNMGEEVPQGNYSGVMVLPTGSTLNYECERNEGNPFLVQCYGQKISAGAQLDLSVYYTHPDYSIGYFVPEGLLAGSAANLKVDWRSLQEVAEGMGINNFNQDPFSAWNVVGCCAINEETGQAPKGCEALTFGQPIWQPEIVAMDPAFILEQTEKCAGEVGWNQELVYVGDYLRFITYLGAIQPWTTSQIPESCGAPLVWNATMNLSKSAVTNAVSACYVGGPAAVSDSPLTFYNPELPPDNAGGGDDNSGDDDDKDGDRNNGGDDGQAACSSYGDKNSCEANSCTWEYIPIKADFGCN